MARHFDNWLKAYIAYTLDSESPDDFHFWTGVSTIAGALRRRVWIDMRKWQWTPNFYIVLVGPPGIAAKSTSVRAGMHLLDKIKGVNFGPQSMTWQALTMALEMSIEHLKTVNAKGEDEFIPMSCLTIPVTELGTFLKIDDTALVDVLTDLWDGQLGKWGHKTKTSGNTDIRNPWINVIGCTTPSWMKLHVPEHLIGGGLMSRIIFVYGDAKRKLIPYPDEVYADADYRSLESKLLEDLTDISLMQGAFTLTPAARTWGKNWYSKHWTPGSRPVHMASDRYEGYLSRKQTHMHKLAIILSAARSSRMVIEASHLEEALALLDLVEPHMLKAFESIGVVEEARHVQTLVSFVKGHGKIELNELYRLCANIMSQQDFNEAIVAAVRGGRLDQEKANDGRRYLWPAKPTTVH